MLTRRQLITLLLSGLLAFGFFGCSNPYYDQPPLHEAAKRGNLKKVKELLRKGIDINATNKEGATPLHWAAFKGREDVVKFLLNNGASVNALTSKGSTPLKLAKEHRQKKIIKILKSYGGHE